MKWSVYNLMAKRYGVTADCRLVHTITNIEPTNVCENGVAGHSKTLGICYTEGI